MSLESSQQQVNTLLVGASRISELLNQGYSRDQAEMMLIRQDRGAGRQEELRNNSPRAGERAKELMLPEEREQLKGE